MEVPIDWKLDGMSTGVSKSFKRPQLIDFRRAVTYSVMPLSTENFNLTGIHVGGQCP